MGQQSTYTLFRPISEQALESTKHYANHSSFLARNFDPTVPIHQYFQIGKQPTHSWWQMEERIYTILAILLSSSLNNIRMSRLLSKATQLAQNGKISEAISELFSQSQREGDNYAILNNIAALHLQAGDIEKSIEFSSKAISVDPFAYVAYYNRFLCYFVQEKPKLAWSDLQRALSCLYLIRGYQTNNLKFLNKAISYCQQNARAYLVRAKLNEGKNNKLAENDYSIALEYAPNLIQTYQLRALFYHKLGRTRQFEENFADYTSLKQMGAKHTNELIENQEDQTVSYQEKIVQGAKEFQQLLSIDKTKEDSIKKSDEYSKLPLESVQSKIEKKDDEDLLLSDRAEQEGTAKTIEIRKEEINFRKRGYEDRLDKNFDEIFQDENSKELNEEIEKLQREIQKEGGRLSLQENEELDVSDPNNFLTAEIEKAIEEITKLSNRDNLNDVKSVRSANSNASLGSRGDLKELSTEQFKRYRKFQLEITSLEDLQNSERKQASKIVLRYKDQVYETQMGKFQWSGAFTVPIEFDVFEVDVQAILKGGVFKANSSLGEGTINLLERNQFKCILGSKEKKTAILYYKLVLI